MRPTTATVKGLLAALVGCDEDRLHDFYHMQGQLSGGAMGLPWAKA